MANGKIPLIVKAPNGTDLRREPHMNPKTANGEDNVIRSLPKNTYLRLEQEEIYATDKYRWALVRLQIESNITGWVVADDLGPPSVEASNAPTYPVSFLGSTYKMYQDKLNPAKTAGYILPLRPEWRTLDGMEEIKINRRRYLTTTVNVNVMKSSRWII